MPMLAERLQGLQIDAHEARARQAGEEARWVDPIRGERIEALNHAVAGDEILHVGCSTGVLSDAIFRVAQPRRLTAIDGSAAKIAVARARFEGIEFIHALAEKMPFAEKSFDCVLVGSVIERVGRPEHFVKRLASLARSRVVVLMEQRDEAKTTDKDDGLVEILRAHFARVDRIRGEGFEILVCDEPQPLSCAWTPIVGANGTHVLFHPGRGRIFEQIARKHRFYESDLLDFIASRSRVGTYVDIGAHVGNHAVFFGEECPSERVVAVECDPGALVGVEINIENNFTRVDGELIAAAASDRNGVVDGVRHVRLDDHLARDHVAVVKADIEGMEPQALTGMRVTIECDRPLLAVECWDAEALRRVEDVLPLNLYRRLEHVFCATPTYVWEPI